MWRVDLNCDMGESFGRYRLGQDREILGIVTSANIACGFHAGDPQGIHQTVRLAQHAGTAVGAHPGYPDLLGFGRRSMQVDPEELKDYILYQIGALQAFCSVEDIRLQHVKPHGALYNDAAKDPKLAKAIAEAICSLDKDLILLAPAGSELEKAGLAAGLPTASEVFADRNYHGDGTLVSRSHPHALILDEAAVAERAARMVSEGFVTALDGTCVPLKAHSICVHGDTPGAAAFVHRIRETFEIRGICICALGEVLSE